MCDTVAVTPLHSSLSSDPTLTSANVMEIVKKIHYPALNFIFDVPPNKIYTQYDSTDEYKEALIYHALQTHPCLTWKRLSKKLHSYGYSGAAAEVSRKFLKGQW